MLELTSQSTGAYSHMKNSSYEFQPIQIIYQFMGTGYLSWSQLI